MHPWPFHLSCLKMAHMAWRMRIWRYLLTPQNGPYASSFCNLSLNRLRLNISLLASSASNDPVLHFILFVPSADRKPLRILDADGDIIYTSIDYLLNFRQNRKPFYIQLFSPPSMGWYSTPQPFQRWWIEWRVNSSSLIFSILPSAPFALRNSQITNRNPRYYRRFIDSRMATGRPPAQADIGKCKGEPRHFEEHHKARWPNW